MRILAISIEELRDGRMFKVRTNVPWEAFSQMPSAHQKEGFMNTVTDLREKLERELMKLPTVNVPIAQRREQALSVPVKKIAAPDNLRRKGKSA